MTVPVHTGPIGTAPYTDVPIRLAAALRARPDGWAPAEVDRIAYVACLYPEARACIGSATVNGTSGQVWLEVDATEARLSVYGPWGTLLYRVTVGR